MKPWERRLNDLGSLLEACGRSYFDPELFRRNVNQFLTTARTVTFLVQKNKDVIPDFEAWYKPLQAEWAGDQLMTWARDTRNVIEKEGDLEYFSSLRTTLIFSYLEEEDIKIECGRHELAHANVTRLIRFARRGLPSAISDVAVVKIERRWITDSLPDIELTNALSYVYGHLLRACESLARHLGTQFLAEFRSSSVRRDAVRRTVYVKLRDGEEYRMDSEGVRIDRNFEMPARFKEVAKPSRPPSNLQEAFEQYCRMAELTFEEFGNHIPMLFLFDEKWRVVDMMSAMFADQSDKYIFWRHAGARTVDNGAVAAIWIGESWQRKTSRNDASLMRAMPIVGELLHLYAFDQTGEVLSAAWKILRDGNATKLVRDHEFEEAVARGQLNIIQPVRRVFASPSH